MMLLKERDFCGRKDQELTYLFKFENFLRIRWGNYFSVF